MEATFEDIDSVSLDIVELVMALEEKFDPKISDWVIENIKTVGDGVIISNQKYSQIILR